MIPLYPSAPAAALRNPVLYESLALFDAIRAGNVRERTLAQQLFEDCVFRAIVTGDFAKA